MAVRKPVIHARDHSHGGADPVHIAWEDVGGTTTLADKIVALLTGSDGFWKLNETSGTTAADSSGNGYTMSPRSGLGPPSWANAATPYSENSPVFGGSTNEQQATLPVLSGDLTLFCWAQKSTDIDCSLLGQGPGNTSGCYLNWNNSASLSSAFELLIGGATLHAVPSNVGYPAGAGWHMVAGTRTSSVWRLYVDGAVQTATYTDSGGSYTPAATGAWIGLLPGGTLSTAFHLSYCTILHHALTAAEITDLWTASL